MGSTSSGHGGINMSSSSNSSSGSGYESPMVKQELAKLDKGGDKRRSALVSLRACVDKLDSSTMPRFLSQLQPDSTHSDSRPFAISLYQDVARVHGPLLLPHIPRITATIIRSLTSSGSSLHLHHACAAVVAAIARYAIPPTATAAAAHSVLRELAVPLLENLTARMEPLAGGTAACLHALVESERWKHAPPELAAEISSKCCMGLRERSGQTVAHLHLARSLVKIGAVSPDGGVQLLRSCKEVLRVSGSWQQKAAALQLVRGLMLGLDRKWLATESESIAVIVEQIRLDRMPHVRNEAVKALQTLKAVVSDEEEGGGTTRILLAASAERLEVSSASQQQQRCRSLWDRESSQESQLISFSPESPGGSSPSPSCRLKRASVRAARRPGCFSSSSSSACSSGPASVDFDSQKIDEQQPKEIVKSQSQSQTMENLRYHKSKMCSSTSVASGDEQCVVSSESYRMEVAEFMETTTEQVTNELPAAVEEDDSTPVTKRFSYASTPERSGAGLLTAEDFIRFTTPRRLVRSLQTLASPDAETVTEAETVAKDDITPSSVVSRGSLELELLEASSETGWSVRDNPIAEDHGGFDKLSSSARQYEEREWDLKRDGNAAAAAVVVEEKRGDGHEGNVRKKQKKKRVEYYLEKARGFVELVLAGCVCIALLLPVVMAVVRVLESQGGDLRTLVPT